MLYIPAVGDVRTQHNAGSVGTGTVGTSVSTSGSSNTKGTPAEIFSSTNFDTFWITIIASLYGADAAGAAAQGAMDILIGASTEAVLIPNLLMGHCGGNNNATLHTGPKRWDFPLYIPAASRIAVQAAGIRTSTAFRVAVYLYGGNGSPAFPCGTKVTTYGMGTVPDGTTITPGASGAEGAWAQVTASTSEDHFAFVPSFQASGDSTTNIRNYYVDMGYGAATEEEIMESYVYRIDQNETMEGPWNTMPCFKRIASGSRLVMRASNSGSNDGGYNGVIHAVS